MSTYHDLYTTYQASQQQAAFTLGLLGLGLAVGWLLLQQMPGRWYGAARWFYVIWLACLAGTALLVGH